MTTLELVGSLTSVVSGVVIAATVTHDGACACATYSLLAGWVATLVSLCFISPMTWTPFIVQGALAGAAVCVEVVRRYRRCVPAADSPLLSYYTTESRPPPTV